MIALLTGIGARVVATVGLKYAVMLLAAVGLTSGIAVGYVGGKVAGHFTCNTRIEVATEKARVRALERDLDIAKKSATSDRKLAEKLDRELAEAQEVINEFQSNSCPLSSDDAKRLRNIR